MSSRKHPCHWIVRRNAPCRIIAEAGAGVEIQGFFAGANVRVKPSGRIGNANGLDLSGAESEVKAVAG